MTNETFLNTFLVSGLFTKEHIECFRPLIDCNINLSEYYKYITKLVRTNDMLGVYSILDDLLCVVSSLDDKENCKDYIESYKEFLSIYTSVLGIKEAKELSKLTYKTQIRFNLDELRKVEIRNLTPLYLNNTKVIVKPITKNNLNYLEINGRHISFLIVKDKDIKEVYLDSIDKQVEYLHGIIKGKINYDLLIYPINTSSYAYSIYDTYLKRYKVSNQDYMELGQLLNGLKILSSVQSYNTLYYSNINIVPILHILNKNIDMCRDRCLTVINMSEMAEQLIRRISCEANPNLVANEIYKILKIKDELITYKDTYYYVSRLLKDINNSKDIIEAVKYELPMNILEINLKNTSYTVSRHSIRDTKTNQEYTNVTIIIDKHKNGHIVPINDPIESDYIFKVTIREKQRVRI